MILTIALGIILAFFIMGLLEEIPVRTWYWIWGGVIVILLYGYWDTFWADIWVFALTLGLCGLVYLLAILLEKTFKKRKK